MHHTRVLRAVFDSAIVHASFSNLDRNMENISFDQRLESATPVSEINEELAKLNLAEAEELVHKEKSEVLGRWEDCRAGIEHLFEQLTADKGLGRDYFEVRLRSEETEGITTDTLLRVALFRQWNAEGTYNLHYYKRMTNEKGDTSVDASSPSWGLGRKYVYQYGNLNKRTAELEISGDVEDRDIAFVKYDGRPIGKPQAADTAILLAALREQVEPSLDKTAKALEDITEALKDKGLNPEFANAA